MRYLVAVVLVAVSACSTHPTQPPAVRASVQAPTCVPNADGNGQTCFGQQTGHGGDNPLHKTK